MHQIGKLFLVPDGGVIFVDVGAELADVGGIGAWRVFLHCRVERKQAAEPGQHIVMVIEPDVIGTGEQLGENVLRLMHIGAGQNRRKAGVGEPIRGGDSVKHDPVLLPCGRCRVAGYGVVVHGIRCFDENAGARDRLPEVNAAAADNIVQDPDVPAQGLGFVAVGRRGVTDFHNVRCAPAVILAHENVGIVSDIMGFVHCRVLLAVFCGRAVSGGL